MNQDKQQTDLLKADLLIIDGFIITMNPERQTIENGAIAVKDMQIVDIGTKADIEQQWTAREIFRNSPHDIVLPGLINGHTHAAMNYLRGLGSDLPLEEWLNDVIWPIERNRVNLDWVLNSLQLALAEMIMAGITCYNDMYFFENESAPIVKDAGMRGILGEGVLGFPTPDVQNPEAALERIERLVDTWKDDPLIIPEIAPHSTYTVKPDILLKSLEIAEKYDLNYHIHTNETDNELETVKSEYGTTPIKHLENLGILSRRVNAVHCVWLDDEEIQLLADRQVGVIHCPQSNMKLASGNAPVAKLRKAGVNVSIGTDGASSNNRLDMLREMDFAAKLAKVCALDPTALTSRDVLAMATIEGAKALRMDHLIGSLEKDKQADIIIMSTDSPRMLPMNNPFAHIVYAAETSDVKTTIVGGKVLMKDRELLTLDINEIRQKARELVI
jgi:5-methylthioadenosine/S-adenosylhomocysteine deaminase